jgi:hypothetical protein
MVPVGHSHSRVRRALSLLLAGSLAVSGWLLSSHPHAHAQPVDQNPEPVLLNFKPAADASIVLAGDVLPDQAGRLDLGRQPAALSYLRFEISGVGDLAVRRATLRVYAYDTSPAGYAVQALPEGAWDGGPLSASGKPRPGRVIAVSGMHRAGEYTQVDLTGYVVADGVYSLGLTTTAGAHLTYAGRTLAGFEPRLFLELAEPEAPDPAVVPELTPTPIQVADISGCDVSNLMWTVPGRLLRGGRPSDAGMQCLVAAGVDVLVDQRPPGEAGTGFADQAKQAGLEYINLGIPDDTAPSPGMLSQWLSTVNARLAEGKTVLIHDAAGRGRMGFWDAAYRMLYGGLSPQAAIDGYYVGTAVPFQGAKIDCGNGGQGQVQALAEIAQAITGQPYYPPVDEYGNGWNNCPRPAYMDGWDYSTLF